MLWKGFQKPKRLEVDQDGPDRQRSAASPPSPSSAASGRRSATRCGACCSRRIEGAAITAIRVEGVLHEFSPIPGAMEDTTDLILNLKRVPLKMHVEHPEDAPAQDVGGGRGAGQAHHPRPRRRDPRPRGLHRHPRPGLDPLRGDAGQAGPRLRLRGQELRRGPLHRLDPRGLRPLAGEEGQLLRRERPRRPGHRLREAHPRGLDQRRRHPARRRRAWPPS